VPGVAERAARIGELSNAQRQTAVRIATERRKASTMIDPLWLSSCLGRVVDEHCVVFDDTLNTNRVHDYLRSDRPASYFTNPGTSGGWAIGAAFGGKLADPERDMIAVTGDGFYMFGTTSAVIWAAQQNNAPFMCVIYQNRSYTTGVVGVTRSYGSDSYAQKEGFTGGYFDPPIDFAKEAEAAGAYGENVRDPADVEPALRRGLAEVRNGRTAVLSFWLPRLLLND
jgi:acetolactate synthase-1/2/3 large subunit